MIRSICRYWRDILARLHIIRTVSARAVDGVWGRMKTMKANVVNKILFLPGFGCCTKKYFQYLISARNAGTCLATGCSVCSRFLITLCSILQAILSVQQVFFIFSIIILDEECLFHVAIITYLAIRVLTMIVGQGELRLFP